MRRAAAIAGIVLLAACSRKPVTHVSTAGNYSIEFPSSHAGLKTNSRTQDASGRSIQITMTEAENTSHAVPYLGAGHLDFPADLVAGWEPYRILEVMLPACAAGMSGRVIEQHVESLQPRLVMEATTEGRHRGQVVYCRIRMMMEGSRVFFLIAAARTQEALKDAMVGVYMRSFSCPAKR